MTENQQVLLPSHYRPSAYGSQAKRSPAGNTERGLSSGGIALSTRQGLNWHCRGGVALTPIKFSLKLWTHDNSVIHSDDPWCQPGGAFGFLPLRPGSHVASKDNLTATVFFCYTICVYLLAFDS